MYLERRQQIATNKEKEIQVNVKEYYTYIRFRFDFYC